MMSDVPSVAANLINKSRIQIHKMSPASNCAPLLKETAATAAVGSSVHSAGFLTVFYTWLGLIFAGTFSKTKYLTAFSVIQ